MGLDGRQTLEVNKDDDELILAAQKGPDGMSALLTQWNDPIFGFFMRTLKNRADAEDATQETFIRVVKGLPNYKHSGKFGAWIFRIARNQAALTAKRRLRLDEREVRLEPQVMNSFFADESDDFDNFERAAFLRRAIAKLPEREREVVTLRLDEGLKFADIAVRTGSPLNTVLGRMRNATKRLREQLTEQS